jgi:hypothetical protein
MNSSRPHLRPRILLPTILLSPSWEITIVGPQADVQVLLVEPVLRRLTKSVEWKRAAMPAPKGFRYTTCSEIEHEGNAFAVWTIASGQGSGYVVDTSPRHICPAISTDWSNRASSQSAFASPPRVWVGSSRKCWSGLRYAWLIETQFIKGAGFRRC